MLLEHLYSCISLHAHNVFLFFFPCRTMCNPWGEVSVGIFFFNLTLLEMALNTVYGILHKGTTETLQPKSQHWRTFLIVCRIIALNQVDAPTPPLPGTSYSGYEAAVYSAASTYYQQQQQQQQQKQAVAAVAASAGWTGSTFTKKPPFQSKQLRPKQPPKPPQIHYCDVCKISCAGPQVSYNYNTDNTFFVFYLFFLCFRRY